nr:MAG TPA: hypothetical protein [Caudoviricetes sp.]
MVTRLISYSTNTFVYNSYCQLNLLSHIYHLAY